MTYTTCKLLVITFFISAASTLSAGGYDDLAGNLIKKCFDSKASVAVFPFDYSKDMLTGNFVSDELTKSLISINVICIEKTPLEAASKELSIPMLSNVSDCAKIARKTGAKYMIKGAITWNP